MQGAEGSTPNIVNVTLPQVGVKNDLKARYALSAKARGKREEEASVTFREKVSSRMITALDRFKPDIIFISAGFDGHR
jgi:acetoin utilization deacetylase AcuC-like enzyme